MKKRTVSLCIRIVLLTFTGLFILGCSHQKTDLTDRETLLRALDKAEALSNNRQRVHLSHVCTLEINRKRYPVVDIRELVRGAQTSRGINHILVLDSSLEIKQKIEYTTERPLYCLKNQLFVHGKLMINGLLPEGNVLTFNNLANQVRLSILDVNQLPGKAD